jgi:hypothetical protein
MRRVLFVFFAFTASCGEIVIGDALDGGDEAIDAIDAGARAQSADSGEPECTTPALPATWPFVQSKEVYAAEFFAPLIGRKCEDCHLSLFPPYIPKDLAELDDPAKLTLALKIWERALPTERVTGDSTPGILWRHLEGKGATAPFYDSTLRAQLETFVARGSNCLWAPVAAQGSADPMLCAPPSTDLSYCR